MATTMNVGNNMYETILNAQAVMNTNNSSAFFAPIRNAARQLFNFATSQVLTLTGKAWNVPENIEKLKAMPPATFQRERFIDKVVDAFKKLTSFITKAASLPAFAALAPLKGAMKKKLSAKGISYTNKLEDIAQKFFQNIVKKNYNYSDVVNLYNSKAVSHYNLIPAAVPVAKLTLSQIVPMIIEFFGLLSGKVKNGTANDEEKKLVADAESEINRYETDAAYRARIAEEENSITGKGGTGDIFSIVIIIIAVIILTKVIGK